MHTIPRRPRPGARRCNGPHQLARIDASSLRSHDCVRARSRTSELRHEPEGTRVPFRRARSIGDTYDVGLRYRQGGSLASTPPRRALLSASAQEFICGNARVVAPPASSRGLRRSFYQWSRRPSRRPTRETVPGTCPPLLPRRRPAEEVLDRTTARQTKYNGRTWGSAAGGEQPELGTTERRGFSTGEMRSGHRCPPLAWRRQMQSYSPSASIGLTTTLASRRVAVQDVAVKV